MNMVPLVDKPYINEVNVKVQNLSLKSEQPYESEVCFRRVLIILKELLWVSVGQRVTKLLAHMTGRIFQIIFSF